MKKLLKALSTTLSLILLYESAAIPLAEASALRAMTPPPALTNTAKFSLPLSIGHIVDEQASSDRTIFHIQDIHTDVSAQTNLYGIVTTLSRHAASNGKKLLVFVEGSSGPLDSDLIASMDDKQAVADVGAGLLRKGLLFGEEYAAITNAPGAIKLVGVENKSLHEKNTQARDASEKNRTTVLAGIREISRQLSILNQHNFNPVLARVEKARKAVNSNGVSFVDYVKMLNEAAPSVVAKHPEMKGLLALVNKEKSLDFARIEAAQQSLIVNAAKNSSEAAMKGWMDDALAVKEGRLSPVSYYTALLKKSGTKNAVIESYIAYLKAAEAVDADQALDTIAAVEAAVAAKLIKHPVARQLYAHQRWIERQEQFFALEMIPQEWNKQKSARLNDIVVTLRDINAFMAEQKTSLGYGLKTPAIPFKELSAAFNGASAFYRAATLRDRVMAANVQTYLKNNKDENRMVAFVAGGFHTQGLTKSLEKNGYRVAVVRPQISTTLELSQKYNFLRAAGGLVNASAIQAAIKSGSAAPAIRPKTDREGSAKVGLIGALAVLPVIATVVLSPAIRALIVANPFWSLAAMAGSAGLIIFGSWFAYSLNESTRGKNKSKMSDEEPTPKEKPQEIPGEFAGAPNFVAQLPRGFVASALSANGRYSVSLYPNHTARIVDLAAGGKPTTFFDVAEAPIAAAINNDGTEFMFVDTNGKIFRFETATRTKTLVTRSRGGEELTTLSYGPNNTIYMAGDDFWEHTDPETQGRSMVTPYKLPATAISVGKERAISGHSDGAIRVVNLETINTVVASPSQRPITSVAQNSDEVYAAVGQIGVVRILNTGTNEWVKDFKTAAGPVLAVAYTEDDQYVISVSQDGTVLRHNVAEFKLRRNVIRELGDPSKPHDVLQLTLILAGMGIAFAAGWILSGMREFRQAYIKGRSDQKREHDDRQSELARMKEVLVQKLMGLDDAGEAEENRLFSMGEQDHEPRAPQQTALHDVIYALEKSNMQSNDIHWWVDSPNKTRTFVSFESNGARRLYVYNRDVDAGELSQGRSIGIVSRQDNHDRVKLLSDFDVQRKIIFESGERVLFRVKTLEGMVTYTADYDGEATLTNLIEVEPAAEEGLSEEELLQELEDDLDAEAEQYFAERELTDVLDGMERLADEQDLNEQQLQQLTATANTYGLKEISDKFYLAVMWNQILRPASKALQIITNGIVPGGANFWLSSKFDKSAWETLGVIPNKDIVAAYGQNGAARKELSRSGEVIINAMEAGLGENFTRVLYNQGAPIGAKGTDVKYQNIEMKGFDASGHPSIVRVNVSIAELKLRQIILQAQSRQFSRFTYEVLVNKDSKPHYDKLLASAYLDDRVDQRGNSKDRTYQQMFDELGITVKFHFQDPIPGINAESKELPNEIGAPAQPGGHGQLGFWFFFEALQRGFERARNGISGAQNRFRVFYNGDNLNSRANADIIAHMKENKHVIYMVAVSAEPIDKKGGKIGLRAEWVDGKIVWVPDMMELAQAKAAEKEEDGQLNRFFDAGLEDGDDAQLFNTNVIYINEDILADILADLHTVLSRRADALSNEERGLYEIAKTFAPTRIAKDAKNGYLPVDGAIGSVLLNFNQYFLTSTDTEIKGILEKHGVDRILHFVNVPRIDHFTPEKTPVDHLVLNSDRFELNMNYSSLTDKKPGTPLPEITFRGEAAPGEETANWVKDAGAWADLATIENSFGTMGILNLKSLEVFGAPFTIKDVRFSGRVRIVNERPASDGPLFNLRNELREIDVHNNASVKMYGDQIHVHNVLITIKADGTLTIAPYVEYDYETRVNKEGQVTSGEPSTPFGWRTTALSINPFALGLLVVVVPVVLTIIAFQLIAKYRASRRTAQDETDDESYASTTALPLATESEISRVDLAKGVNRLIASQELDMDLIGVQYVAVNIADFFVHENGADRISKFENAVTAVQSLTARYNAVSAPVNRVHLVVYNADLALSNHEAAINALVGRMNDSEGAVSASFVGAKKYWQSVGDRENVADIFKAAGVQDDLSGQTLHVLAAHNMKYMGKVNVVAVSDNSLHLALALFSYTRFRNPSDVLKDLLSLVQSIFKIDVNQSLGREIETQILVALQA